MKLSGFLKDIKEASYLVHTNEGNNFITAGGNGVVTIEGGTIIIGSFSVNADLDGIINDPVWQCAMKDGFDRYSRTGCFEVGGVMTDVTHTFVSNKCQCCSCNA